MLTLWEPHTKMSLYNRLSWRQKFEDLIAPGENVPEECKRDTTILNISMLAGIRVLQCWKSSVYLGEKRPPGFKSIRHALISLMYILSNIKYLRPPMIQCLFLHTKLLSTLPQKQANPHPRVVWLQHHSRALDIQVATSTYSYLFPSLKKAQIKPSLVGK